MDIWGILEYTAAVTVVGLLIWLVKVIFHDKLDARWHYFIWLVLLVRLLVPFRFGLISTPISVFQDIPLAAWIEMGRILAEKRGYGEVIIGLGKLWLLGAVLLGGFYLAMWTILRIRIAGEPRADENMREYVDGIAAKYGLKSCSDIRMLKSSSPYICGVIRPVLVLPENWRVSADTGAPESRGMWAVGEKPESRGMWAVGERPESSGSRAVGERSESSGSWAVGERPERAAASPETVIVHELLHKRFGDVLINLGIHLVRVINWFNPFIWMLTSVILNDSEALCDQRVLEYCGEEKVRDYGEILISMSEGKRSNPVKAGTSNMAGFYRNMKTRIRRIRDFRRVPRGIGLATLCITLILALAGIGSSAADEGYTVSPVASKGELELALHRAMCYHARTPEEAVYLFLRAYREGNTVYRMSVMPKNEVPQYEAFALEWFERQDVKQGVKQWAELSDEGGYPEYFPGETSAAENFRIYNLLYDEKEGSATVKASFRGSNGRPAFAEWKLTLVKEDGWKVWLESESELTEGEYEPEALVSCSVSLGDFLVEMYGYNEGYFAELESFWDGRSIFSVQRQGIQNERVSFPDCFSQEYKYQCGYVTYLGEENLEESIIKVLVTKGKEEENEWTLDQIERMAAQEYGKPDISTGIGYYGDNSFAGLSGRELMTGKPNLVCGGGVGYTESGQCWKEGEKIENYIRIYVDGVLREEGEIWSETL